MRILHIMGSADVGGIASVVYNYMKHIDQEQYHFDFAVNAIKPGYLEKKMIEMGASFYRLPLRSHGLSEYSKALKRLLSQERFDAIHVHSNSSSYLDLRIAKQMGINCRIAHSHSMGYCSTPQDYIRKYLGQVLNYHYATKVIGCGQKAGDEIFGKRHMQSKKGLVLPNSIETEKYKYDSVSRLEIRKEFRIENKYVIGMVSRISPEKNHKFAMNVLKGLLEENSECILMIVGGGYGEEILKEYAKDLGICGNVIFVGERNDVERYYSAMDICIMPSQFEGFPVTGIEAIAAGLPVLFSEAITKELAFGIGVQYLPLVEEIWIDCLRVKPENSNRQKNYLYVSKNGYDVESTAKILQSVYDLH